MKRYKIKYRFPLASVIKIPPGAPETLGGTVIVESEDEGLAADEVEYMVFSHPLAPTYVDGSKIKPIITSIEEVID